MPTPKNNCAYLFVLDLSWHKNLAIQVSRTSLDNLQFHLSVINEKDMSNLRSLNDLRMGQPNALVGTRNLLEIESKDLTRL